jgi:hypothetical protein
MRLDRSKLLPHGFWGSRLPPGVRDADCRPHSRPSLRGFTERDLWQICGWQYQERLCSAFTESNREFVRDAILDAEDGIHPSMSAARQSGAHQSAARGPSLLGELIWAEWLRFRDRALRDILQSGELPET